MTSTSEARSGGGCLASGSTHSYVPHMLDILAVEVLVGFEAACESLAIGRRGTGSLKVNV